MLAAGAGVGYFGAGQGILVLGLMGLLLDEDRSGSTRRRQPMRACVIWRVVWAATRGSTAA